MQTLQPLDICRTIVHKMKVIDFLEADSEWDPTTLSQGYPGLICLFTELNFFFPNEKWDAMNHHCVEKLVQAIKQRGIYNSSLFAGTAGICLSLDIASQGNGNYSTLRSSLHSQLLKEIRANYLEPLYQAKQEGLGFPPRLYDLISGLTGMLPYLLRQTNRQDTLPIILEMLSILVDLTKPLTVEGKHVPGWLIPAKYTNPGEHCVHGCLDTGMAHGIAGVLCVLAKALHQGISVQGHQSAMRSIITWLQKMQYNIGSFQNIWPSRFGAHYSPHDHPEIITSCRDGWCYGAPGTAFSLFMAAHALQDPLLYDYALEAMRSACHRLNTNDSLDCLSICHGKAGALAIMHQMYLAAGIPVFAQTAEQICLKILKEYKEELPFGFKTHTTSQDGTEKAVDSLSIIEGTIGIVLSLLFQQSRQSRSWLQIFLLN